MFQSSNGTPIQWVLLTWPTVLFEGQHTVRGEAMPSPCFSTSGPGCPPCGDILDRITSGSRVPRHAGIAPNTKQKPTLGWGGGSVCTTAVSLNISNFCFASLPSLWLWILLSVSSYRTFARSIYLRRINTKLYQKSKHVFLNQMTLFYWAMYKLAIMVAKSPKTSMRKGMSL